jgi:hypothetical protein
MADLMQCFSIEELEALDEHQLALLRFAIQRDVRINPDIHKIIRDKFLPMRDRMASQRRPPRRARSRRTPPATDPSTSD